MRGEERRRKRTSRLVGCLQKDSPSSFESHFKKKASQVRFGTPARVGEDPAADLPVVEFGADFAEFTEARAVLAADGSGSPTVAQLQVLNAFGTITVLLCRMIFFDICCYRDSSVNVCCSLRSSYGSISRALHRFLLMTYDNEFLVLRTNSTEARLNSWYVALQQV